MKKEKNTIQQLNTLIKRIKVDFFYVGFASILIGSNALAQNSIVDTTKKEISVSAPFSRDNFKFNLNEDGSHYVRLNFIGQLWLRDNWNNPGSALYNAGTTSGALTATNGRLATQTYDVGLRRARVSISSQLSDRVFIYGQMASDGVSSLTGGRSLPLSFIDLFLDYKLLGNYLSVGGGLIGWDGLSRFSNAATTTILGLDAPLYQQATASITDQQARTPGIYAKGKLGKLDYRVAVNIPYPTTASTAITQSITVATATANPQFNAPQFAPNRVQAQLQGYFMYQFLDQESNLIANTVGSYLGQKRVFNIGAGFRYQQSAMWKGDYNEGITSKGTQTLTIKDTTRTDMFLWSVDLFYDTPINKDKGTALTFYAAYTNYNFGQNYIRNNSGFNPVNASAATNSNTNFNPNLTSSSGSGNQYPMVGTGSTYYAQAGYLLPKFKNGTQFQPYGEFLYANYTALKDPVIVWDLGLNYLIKGHNSKFSLDYQSRPIFNYSTTDNQIHEVKSARRGCIVLQYQIAF